MARRVDGRTVIGFELRGVPVVDGDWILDGKVVPDYVPPKPEKKGKK